MVGHVSGEHTAASESDEKRSGARGSMWCVSRRRCARGADARLTSTGMDLPAIRFRSAGTFSMSSATSAACFSPPICSRHIATPYVYVDFDHCTTQEDATR